MTTTLLILTSILLALSGLAIMHLAERLKEAETVQANDRHMIKTMQLHLEDMLETDAVNEQLTAHNRELNAQMAETKRNAYNRQQELLNALEDATKAADDNEWLYQDSEKCYAEAVAALAELQEVHKAYVEGMTTAEAQQAAEMKELQEELNNTQYRLNQKYNEISDLKQSLYRTIDYWEKAASANRAARNELASVKDELAEIKSHADNLMTDRIEAIAHLRQQNEQIAKLELKAFYEAEEELTEAIAAAEEASTEEEAIIRLEDKLVWSCLNWERLIVYKSSPYHCYIQKGLGAKIERLAAADLSEAQAERFKALKQAVKYI
jgi:chromosome segregation ATPase